MSTREPLFRGRPRLLFVQPSLQPPGGGNGVCAWMLRALREDCQLDLLTWHPVDLDAVNRYFGTDLEPGQLHYVPFPRIARLLDLTPTPMSMLKSAMLLRRTRAIAHRYDALVTANNEADFGCPGIQYVHYPWNLRPRPAGDMRWYHFRPLLRRYYGVVNRLSPFDADRVRRNLTLVNSEWTGALLRELYPGIRPRTLYPPVSGSFPAVPWAEREDGIVVVGRISPEKRVDLAIEIVRRVRERGHDLKLHVIGTDDDRSAYRKVKALAREHSTWLLLHENLARDELCALLTRQRYGLHAMAEEHYGLAVAEMVIAGLVPFVPDGGGQREIVESMPEVCWRTPEEAVERICAVASDPVRRQRLLHALAARREALGTSHFERRVREEVAAFLHQQVRTVTESRTSSLHTTTAEQAIGSVPRASMRLSAAIIAHDEVRKIGRTLKALAGWADEILVVDAGSTDGTQELCRRLGATVIQQEWLGYGAQKNVAIAHCHAPWILSLDADEVVTPRLRQAIEAVLAAPTHDVYAIAFENVLFGQRVRHGGWYGFHRTRLFRRGVGRWDDAPIHETFVTQQPLGTIDVPLEHYSYLDATEYRRKFERYTTLEAVAAYSSGQAARPFRAVAQSLYGFLRMYVLRGGFLDGAVGFRLARDSARYFFTRDRKLARLWRGDSPRAAT